MLHQPLGGAGGQASDIEIHARHILETKDILYNMIADCTGQDREQIIKDCDRDNFIKAKDAAKYGKHGLIDKVITRQK